MSNRRRWKAYYPTLHEIAALRVLTRKPDAYARELAHGNRGKVPIDQIYMILKRLRERGAVEVLRARRIPPAGGRPQKLYRITRYGRRCVKAIQILEARS